MGIARILPVIIVKFQGVVKSIVRSHGQLLVMYYFTDSATACSCLPCGPDGTCKVVDDGYLCVCGDGSIGTGCHNIKGTVPNKCIYCHLYSAFP